MSTVEYPYISNKLEMSAAEQEMAIFFFKKQWLLKSNSMNKVKSKLAGQNQ